MSVIVDDGEGDNIIVAIVSRQTKLEWEVVERK
jgi:hypothetical protein